MVRRVYVEKKPEYAGKARELKEEIKSFLGIDGVESLRILIRYDVEQVSEEVFEEACSVVFSEPPVDLLYRENFPDTEGAEVFSVEALPGQFDQRADSAEQCIRFLKGDETPIVRTATTYVLTGQLTPEEITRIRGHVMNPVDSRIADEAKPAQLGQDYPEPEDVAMLTGFTTEDEAQLRMRYEGLGLAMTWA